MTTRTVISRTRRAEQPDSKEFVFTREMIPTLAGDLLIPGFINEYRLDAWETYEQLPLPSTSDEAWRRTDLKGLHAGALMPANLATGEFPEPPEDFLRPLAGETYGGQIVLSPAGIQVSLLPELQARGVIFTDLLTASQKHPEIMFSILGKVTPARDGKFAALASALANRGVLLYVPRGVHVDQPLHSILWGSGVRQAYFSHILVWVDEGASVTYVHESASHTETNGQSMHAGIVEIQVEQGASLRFVELQSWGEHVWNFTHERARVGRDANLDWVFGSVGSHLTKNFSDLDLAGQGANGRMSGFYFTDGVQHLDHDTQQNHLAAHTTSDLLFKGALREKSRSVWQGMIYVAPGAQRTDGYQANRNLVLSPNARADSIPGLEILADDVRCTHGATVGKIDADQVFYLRSRGIPYRDAERLIVEGFFDPIMQRIPFEGVRSRFQDAIREKMG
jgi:Fe-S cluster assembly protein SufD